MAASDLIRVIPVLMAPVVVALVIGRKRLIGQLRRAGATTESSAVPLEPVRPLGTWWRARLLREGVVRAAPDGRLWLSQVALRRDRARLLRRNFTLVLGVALLVALYGLIGPGF